MWFQIGEFQVLADTLVEADSLLEEEFWSSRDREFGVGQGRPLEQDVPRERGERLRTEPWEHGFLRSKRRKSLPREKRPERED